MAAMLRRHRALIVVLVPAAALRLFPYQAKPDGYPLRLRLLEPTHSLRLVATLQHLLGLAVGVTRYTLLLRLRLPPWAGLSRWRRRCSTATSFSRRR